MFWMLLLVAQVDSGGLVTRHVNGVAYTRTDVESACGAHVIQIRYRNDWPRGIRGQVNFVRVDNADVAGAAAGLQSRAANRTVERIGVMNCGFDERNPVIMGVMVLSRAASQRENLPSSIYFYLRREGSSWQISWS